MSQIVLGNVLQGFVFSNYLCERLTKKINLHRLYLSLYRQ